MPGKACAEISAGSLAAEFGKGAEVLIDGCEVVNVRSSTGPPFADAGGLTTIIIFSFAPGHERPDEQYLAVALVENVWVGHYYRDTRLSSKPS